MKKTLQWLAHLSFGLSAVSFALGIVGKVGRLDVITFSPRAWYSLAVMLMLYSFGFSLCGGRQAGPTQ